VVFIQERDHRPHHGRGKLYHYRAPGRQRELRTGGRGELHSDAPGPQLSADSHRRGQQNLNMYSGDANVNGSSGTAADQVVWNWVLNSFKSSANLGSADPLIWRTSDGQNNFVNSLSSVARYRAYLMVPRRIVAAVLVRR